jgi:hypothetical protein
VHYDPLLYHYAEDGFYVKTKTPKMSLFENANYFLTNLVSCHIVVQPFGDAPLYLYPPGGSLTDVQRFINYIESINPYVYFDYLTGKFWLFDIKYEEEDRLLAIKNASDGLGWITQLEQYCGNHHIAFVDVMRQAEDRAPQELQAFLHSCAESGTRFIKGSAEQSALILRLQRGLSTNNKQPGIFNALLQEKSLPYEIDYKQRKKFRGDKKTCWQIIRKDTVPAVDEQE